ncbi:MAG: sigma-70 family RNA polymerase sigma factor [Acidobacteria bacterium]|nr:sigma-70 family RNA polymerase sigma factor [Acidobacteriota bacterium]
MPQYTENARMFAEEYDELRRIARRCFHYNPADHTLQPTALVNEAFTKIVRQRNIDPSNRSQFLGVAAMIIRRKLMDYQRMRSAVVRGGGAVHVELDDAVIEVKIPDVDYIGLDRAIEKLRELHERQAQVVDLKYCLGMTIEEVAAELGISLATVKTDWAIARAFLRRELEGAERGDGDA